MRNYWLRCSLLTLALFVLAAGCAPGNIRWQGDNPPANFWAGLWHGFIIIVTFIVSLFTSEVGIYEPHNIGWGYNIGFILGCMMSLGGGVRATTHGKRRRHDVDWDAVGRRISDGIREGLKSRPEPAEPTEPDWDELGRRIEERVKDELNKAGFRR